MKYLAVLLMLALTVSRAAVACSIPPEDYFLEPKELVLQASAIVLAKALKVAPTQSPEHQGDYYQSVQFEVVEVIKGAPPANFALIGLTEPNEQGDFRGHADSSFWEYAMTGNGAPTGDCNAYGRFVVGKDYMVFFGVNHTKAFEEITNPAEDRWYETVKSTLVTARP